MLAHSLTESDGAGDSPDAGFVDAGAVLVIDDSATSRGVVATALRSLGYAVTEAASGRAGLEEALRGSFELILLDIDMPDLNGHAVLLGVRDKYSESECPVIVFIRSDSDEEVLRSLRGGASDCIRKPLNMASLIARVRTQLRRTRAEAELRDARQALEAQVSTRTAKLIRSNELLLNQVSEQRAAEADLQRSEERYRALFAQNPAMFYTVERDGLISSTNGFGARQLGYAETEIVGRPLSVLYLDSEWPSIEAYIGTCWENPAGVGRWETRVIKRDGSTLWVRTTGRVVDYGQTQQLLLVSEDITEAHNLSELLTYQASHDPLTGLVNRREFEKRLQRVLDTSRGGDDTHALCYMDLDQFKIVNDTCGHLAGDELLRQLSGILQETVRRRDTLSRLGGDEFGVLMEYCGLEQARRVANGIRDAVSEFRFAWLDKSFSLGVSIGLVLISGTTEAVADVMRAADTACYVAKDAGRNRIHEFREDDEQLARRHGEMQWLVQVQRALDEDRFFLEYQPMRALGDEGDAAVPSNVEVLLRMRDLDGRVVPPGAFLPTTQRYNLSQQIDQWVVGRAFEWLASEPMRSSALTTCCINVSGESMIDAQFLRFLEDRFREFQLSPSRVCFEFSETSAISNLGSATRFAKVLKDWGCGVALDGFGGGLSSYGYLKSLPVDVLKVDGTFVKDIVEDPLDLAMVQSYHQIGRVTGKRTVALYVETPQILAKVQQIGFDFAQGHCIGEPRPLSDFPT